MRENCLPTICSRPGVDQSASFRHPSEFGDSIHFPLCCSSPHSDVKYDLVHARLKRLKIYFLGGCAQAQTNETFSTWWRLNLAKLNWSPSGEIHAIRPGYIWTHPVRSRLKFLAIVSRGGFWCKFLFFILGLWNTWCFVGRSIFFYWTICRSVSVNDQFGAQYKRIFPPRRWRFKRIRSLFV